MALTTRRNDPDLISHMQDLAEREKAVLARELHDELGGLLVAASMDLSWLDQHLMPSQECRRRLDRLTETLTGAVDIKRRIIEELRPTLLDNVGLFAALRWFVSNTCARAGIACSIRFPPSEPRFNPGASIALFRIAQEAFGVVMENKWVRSVVLHLDDAGPTFSLSVFGHGDAHAADPAEAKESFELAAIRHRSAALGGGLSYACTSTGIKVEAWLPAGNTLAS